MAQALFLQSEVFSPVTLDLKWEVCNTVAKQLWAFIEQLIPGAQCPSVRFRLT